MKDWSDYPSKEDFLAYEGVRKDGMFNMFCRIKHLENVCGQVYALIDLNKKLKKL